MNSKRNNHEQQTEANVNEFRDYITLRTKKNQNKLILQDQERLINIISSQNYKNFINKVKDNQTYMEIEPEIKQQDLQEMMAYAKIGKNICIYGIGSKINFIKTRIMSELRQDRFIWEAKGYMPTVNDKKIITHFGGALTSAGIIGKIQSVSFKDQAHQIKAKLLQATITQPDLQITIVIHSLDGPALLNKQAQNRIAQIFNLPNIQLICSIDSIKSVLTWSPMTLHTYKFMFFNVDTLKPYVIEQTYRPHELERKEKSERSLNNIWLSLNENQKKILQVIAANELSNFQRSQQSYYTMGELLQICIDATIISDDNQLRENLVQLLDHQVIYDKLDEKKNKKVYAMRHYQKQTLQKLIDGKMQQ